VIQKTLVASLPAGTIPARSALAAPSAVAAQNGTTSAATAANGTATDKTQQTVDKAKATKKNRQGNLASAQRSAQGRFSTVSVTSTGDIVPPYRA